MAHTPRPDGAPWSIAGQRALVTGASQGIGAAIADALALAGTRLVISARNEERLRAQAFQLARQHGAEVVPIAADLHDVDEVERLAAAASVAFDGLDILVNNAGISLPQAVADLDAASWDATMAVNLRAPALLCSRIGAAMAASGRGGRIVNVASAAGTTALHEHYAYCASKAALIMATKVVALELGGSGVRANVLCPTVVMTEMGEQVWGDAEKAAPLLSRVPAGHFAAPADVANAVLYLASPAAEMINGAVLPIDGGYSAA